MGDSKPNKTNEAEILSVKASNPTRQGYWFKNPEQDPVFVSQHAKE